MKRIIIYLSIIIISLLPMNLTALQEDNNGADSTKSGSQTTYGHWANYGSISKDQWCFTIQTIMIGNIPTFTASLVVKKAYFLKEQCDPGRTGNDCTIGTVRLTYQGGGC